MNEKRGAILGAAMTAFLARLKESAAVLQPPDVGGCLSGVYAATGKKGVRPADRVLDCRGVIPPKGGHNHGPGQNTERAEGTAMATMDRPVAGERAERAGLL